MRRLQSSPAATAEWALRPVGNSEDWASRSFFVVAIHRRANTPQPSFLTRAEDIAALVMYARRNLRRVDVLVNNAGIYLEISGTTVKDRISAFDARLEVV